MFMQIDDVVIYIEELDKKIAPGGSESWAVFVSVIVFFSTM
jgi:hypothetical protein